MTEAAKKTYRLFVLKPDGEGISAAGKERFYRATPGYILVYTAGEITVKHAEITEKEAHRLSKADMEWLRGCFRTIIEEQLHEQESKMAERIGKRLDDLETALKAEKERLEQEG